MEETKECPFCAETIKAKAIVCRYCGRDLPIEPENKVEIQEEVVVTPAFQETSPVEQKTSLGRLFIFLLITLAVAGGIYLLMKSLDLTQPSSPSYSPTNTSVPFRTSTPSKSSSSSSSTVTLGTWLDSWGGLTRTIVITKSGSTYKIKSTYSDGSGETKDLGVETVNGETRLFENPGNYYGDYMIIRSDGSLAFYDNKGLIYVDQP